MRTGATHADNLCRQDVTEEHALTASGEDSGRAGRQSAPSSWKSTFAWKVPPSLSGRREA